VNESSLYIKKFQEEIIKYYYKNEEERISKQNVNFLPQRAEITDSDLQTLIFW
jgi:hypothetical protein